MNTLLDKILGNTSLLIAVSTPVACAMVAGIAYAVCMLLSMGN